ncbi:MAG: TAT-variant-translocated molybdopterin oxidoreductase [Flavobacteriales bacterium]
MEVKKRYWKGVEELKESPSFLKNRDSEFPYENAIEQFLADEQLSESSTGRRDFLKFLGFSVAAATLAACEAPITKAVPYVNKPENVTPGLATWYASTYYDGSSYASVLVKTREGRPIFIKGNKDYGFTNGAVNPQIIASVLGLYDGDRLNAPRFKGKNTTVQSADNAIISALKQAKRIAVLTPTLISPSLKKALADFSAAYGSAEESRVSIVQHDAVSYSAMLSANEKNFGRSFIPTYDFSQAKVVVGVGADFLSTWLMANEYAPQYAQMRNPDKEMSRHYQAESVLSITGSNADVRVQLKPSETSNLLSYILKALGGQTSVSSALNAALQKAANAMVSDLKKAIGKSLVVCGSNLLEDQLLTNAINEKLQSYGKTIKLDVELNLFRSQDAQANQLFESIIKGQGPDVLINLGANPVYSHPKGDELKKGLGAMKMYVSTAHYADESSAGATYHIPDHHLLEGWNDFMPKTNHYAIAQPTIRPLGNTYSALESILVWSSLKSRSAKASDSTVAYDYIMANAMAAGYITSVEDFNATIHNSCKEISSEPLVATYTAVTIDGKNIPAHSGLEVVFYQKTAIRDGALSSNPWLQELPDPISKVTWDNYITMNPVEMERQGYNTTFDQEHGLSLATISVGGKSLTLPVYPQPGQALGTIGIAVGYGRGENGERIGKGAYQTKEYGGYELDAKGQKKGIGQNVYRLMPMVSGNRLFSASAKLSKAEGTYVIAATQIHHTVMGRDSIVRETTRTIYPVGEGETRKNKNIYNPPHTLQRLNEHGHHEEAPVSEFDLWNAHPVENVGHRWGMTIDLSTCIGCGSCLVACQAENNVPVVGKDEVRRGREMHWLRIDRYYASDQESQIGKKKDEHTFDYTLAEKAAVNPSVVHMPLMCHHCNHAPCETVCPVAATTHSNEGLNQMTYNRCIGTRYCANNCPYKVRRFNWFNYPSYKKFTEINPAQDDLGRMVLNPDVTVRTRGVMEKCSFCVQRIQSVKLDAKKNSSPVKDGDLKTACSEVCPTNAIIVGDWNDTQSEIRKSSSAARSYQALEEVGVKPNIWYKVKVRNQG